jgi:hypothetical protein
MLTIPTHRHVYTIHVKHFPIELGNFLMVANAGRNMYFILVYFNIKLVTLDGIIIYYGNNFSDFIKYM